MQKRKSLSKGLHIAILAISVFYMSGVGVLVTPRVANAASIGTYDQCSNDDGDGYASGDTGCRWTNGNLQSNNSTYFEGDATVQRVWLDGFDPGTSHSITLQYGTTKQGKHAYDFLTSWNWSEGWATEADLCQDIIGCVTADASENTLAIPHDPNGSGQFETGTRNFVMRGGTLDGATTPSLSGLYTGDSETSITVSFDVAVSGDMCTTKGQTTTCGVALFFGAHISRTDEWLPFNGTTGATTISGSPYHVALSELDGSSVGNRDNQMQAGAVIPPEPGALTVTKVVDSGTASPDDFSFSINPDPNAIGTVNPTNGSYTFTNLEAGFYTITETDGPDGYHQVTTTCANVEVPEGQTASCEVHNARDMGDVTFEKVVSGGTAAPSDWTFTVDGQGTYNHGQTVSLPTGNYSVTENGPLSYHSTGVSGICSGLQGTSAALTVTTEGGTCTFSNARDTGRIDGTKFEDENGNGIWDNEEPPIAGVQIELSTGALDTTDGTGYFNFENLPTGTYSVEEHLGAGWINTTPNPVNNVVVTTNQTTTVNFGNFELGKIYGYKWNDVDSSGDWTNGDFVLQGWSICIDGIGCTLTDEFGYYEFTGLTAGTYTVFETVLPGWTAIFPATSHEVQIQSGDEEQADFFNFRYGKISGYKFEDLDGDGSWEAGEPALQNWEFNLGGDGSDQTTTNVSGFFKFENLEEGTYTVTETLQDGWTQTTSAEGPYVVTSGSDYHDNVFGNFNNVDITICKALDEDGNSETTEDQSSKSGWSVYLAKNNQAVDQGQVTGENGCYTWSNLGPGSYEAAEATPWGWVPLYDDGTHDFGTVMSGETYEHTFVNTREKGEVTINKIVEGGTAQDSDWTFTLHANQEGLSDIENIPEGTTISVPTGSYTVTESGPSQYSFVTVFGNCAEEGDIELNVTTEGATCWFVNETYAIHGQKWSDENGNGTWDEGENPLNGWNMSLYNDDVLVASILTQNHEGQDGWYWFDDLAAGTYEICETAQDGWDQTYPLNENNNCHTIELPLQFNYETDGPPELENSTCTLSLDRYNQITVVENSIASEALCNFGNKDINVTLELEKSNDQEVVEGGDGLLEATETITYRIDWGVGGNSDATEVVLTDVIPVELNLNVASISNGGTWDAATRTITWDFGTQAPGTTGFVTYTATVLTTVLDGTDIINTALLSASNSDPLFLESESAVEVNVPKVLGDETEPILTIEKTADVATVNPNGSVTYTVVVKNIGDGASINTILTDSLPAGFTFEGGASTKTWNLGTIAAGAEQTLTYTVRVGTDLEAGDYINTATVKADNHGEVSDTAQVTVKIPKVLGATTGASMSDYAIFISALSVIIAGFLLIAEGKRRKKGLLSA